MESSVYHGNHIYCHRVIILKIQNLFNVSFIHTTLKTSQCSDTFEIYNTTYNTIYNTTYNTIYSVLSGLLVYIKALQITISQNNRKSLLLLK